MNVREKILNEIKTGKSAFSEVTITNVEGIQYVDKKQQFIQTLKLIGGDVIEVANESEVNNYLSQEVINGKKVITILKNEKLKEDKNELYNIDIACIKGGIAIAENGAIWVTEKNMGNRILPFSCEQLILVIEERNILNNMHEAYDLIEIAEDGYGVFIAGPSKTADIEQSLVIGTHGPISFKVFIIND